VTRWLVTGAGGQLGGELVRVLADRPDVEVTGLDRRSLDVADARAVTAAVASIEPDVVVHAAAYTAVDDAEAHPDQAWLVNVNGAAHVAAACARTGARLVHLSTDYVFAGDAEEPYAEDAPCAPVNVYGRTKLAGEQSVVALAPDAFVVRTSWLYGGDGPSFVRTMVRLEREQATVRVVADQHGSPTRVQDLAVGLVALGAAAVAHAVEPGVYHCTNAGATTWYGLARAVFEEVGADPDRVRPTDTASVPRPAPRPRYSVLSHRRWHEAGLPAMRPWRPALHDALRDPLGPRRAPD
jgi:dTDP-4-dehydrorhamnose reductase